MFSAKNYGLPKDLIEAAKRVHEKQLEEQKVPIFKGPGKPYRERPEGWTGNTSSDNIPAAGENDNKAQKLPTVRSPKESQISPSKPTTSGWKTTVLPPIPTQNPALKVRPSRLERGFDSFAKTLRSVKQNLSIFNTKSEEVQFTEEELAEAFAIFLEENFHVEMLTEEDLDYVFENEFPQWLEEGLKIIPLTSEELRKQKEKQRKLHDEKAKKNEKIPMV
jgi:hypothetical protein